MRAEEILIPATDWQGREAGLWDQEVGRKMGAGGKQPVAMETPHSRRPLKLPTYAKTMTLHVMACLKVDN